MLLALVEYLRSAIDSFLAIAFADKLKTVSVIITIGTITTASIRKINNWYLARRFKLSGTYLTIYEDPKANGDSQFVYAQSTLRQIGRRIKIKSVESDGRSWNQNANIVRDEYISGWYSSDNPFDTGVGTFFLQIEHRQLIGQWHGHDHNGRQINSGMYKFLKMEDGLHIKELTDQYIAGVLEIADNAFGHGYLDAAALHQKDSKTFVAVRHGRIVGFVLTKLLPAKRLNELSDKPEFRSSALNYSDDLGCVGVIKTMAVDGEHRSAGIGSQLLDIAESYLFKNGAKAIVVPIWLWTKSGSLENIARIKGYSKFFGDPTYWKEDCDAGKFRCIARRKSGPCVCQCVFYLKTMRAYKKTVLGLNL